MISGHSETGISNTGDMICRLIKGFTDMGSAPSLDLSIDLTPVDYVSQAVVHLSLRPHALPPIFHLTNPHPSSMEDLLQAIGSWGYPLRRITYEAWQHELKHACHLSSEHILAPLLPAFLNKLPGDDMTYLEASSMCINFDCSHTEAGLSGTAISCPPPTALLQTYRDYFNESGFLRPLLVDTGRECAATQ
jgi:thioester reductase-like protein